MPLGYSIQDEPQHGKSLRYSGRFYIGVAIIVGITAFVIGILIGRYATCPDQSVKDSPFARATQEADPEIGRLLHDSISNSNIEQNLRWLTEKPHIAGNTTDFRLVDRIIQDLKSYGLDSVRRTPYEVLLSYPDLHHPNRVQLLSRDESILFDSQSQESNITREEGVVPPFLAYSPAKEEKGDLMYANYGRVEDFEYLAKNNFNISGKIVICRYGKNFRGSKVDLAAKYGAIGVIIYSDPKDYTWPEEDDRVYPDTVWLPPTAAQRGSILSTDGDALTPGYPSIRTAFRLNETSKDVPLPTIPAHPIGYGAAIHFLSELEGPEVPPDWRGGLNITYRFGGLNVSRDLHVRMNITSRNSIHRADNVIGIIKGAVEPDRYVLLGNHRDAWIYGSIDPSSGTAVMLEVARAMAALVKAGRWRPRRSIMFCSWGAEEYGLLGSTEWVEQYVKTLGARAVAYVNMDIAVQGNFSARALGTPLMYRPLFEAAKKVSNPNSAEAAAGRTTVYDTWLRAFPWANHSFPTVGSLGSASDYAPLLQIAGITSVDFRYTYDSNKYKIGSYPLYHTEYETFDAVKNLYDKEFKYHQAVARVGAEMLRSLGDSLIIPFNVSDYAWGLELNRQQLDKDYGAMLRGRLGDNYTNLEDSIQKFKEDVLVFEKFIQQMDRTDPMAVRMVNDQLLLLEKAFLDPNGLPSRKYKKHLLFAENAQDNYAGSSFPGLVDLLFDLRSAANETQWQKVEEHFSVIVHVIRAAGFSLRDVINFVEETY